MVWISDNPSNVEAGMSVNAKCQDFMLPRLTKVNSLHTRDLATQEKFGSYVSKTMETNSRRRDKDRRFTRLRGW
jgi:hypothetical protein